MAAGRTFINQTGTYYPHNKNAVRAPYARCTTSVSFIYFCLIYQRIDRVVYHDRHDTTTECYHSRAVVPILPASLSLVYGRPRSQYHDTIHTDNHHPASASLITYAIQYYCKSGCISDPCSHCIPDCSAALPPVYEPLFRPVQSARMRYSRPRRMGSDCRTDYTLSKACRSHPPLIPTPCIVIARKRPGTYSRPFRFWRFTK